MLIQDNQFDKKQSNLIAQVETDSPATESPPVVSLSDMTRLGPYSVLLKEAFEESESQPALTLNESLSSFDVVAIARSLTSQEKAQGLEQQLVTREKIALIVDVNNPFQGSLTLEQVAKIFRGEITNWSQLGGSDRPLKLVHRPEQNATRQALKGYALIEDSSAVDASTLETTQDTTLDVLAALGIEGISYAPASETIEQFSTRVIPIDNVGVDDGRYPFSLPLNYVYRSQPSAEVQSFLDFLKTPDAESLVEFAQSQPADPSRVGSQPDLALLTSNEADSSESNGADAIASQTPDLDDTPADNAPTEAIPATPIDPPVVPEGTSEGVASDPPISIDPSDGFGGAWIPVLLVFLAMGVLGWLTYMRVALEKKRQRSSPRPAPDYAARLNAQGSNRNLEELKAIASGPQNAKGQNVSQRLAEPDLSLSGSESSQIDESAISELGDEDSGLEDATTLQGPSLEFSDSPSDVDVTTIQTPAPVFEEDVSDDATASHPPQFEDEDEPIVLQSSLEPDLDAADDLLSDMTILQGGPSIDPLSDMIPHQTLASSFVIRPMESVSEIHVNSGTFISC